MAPRGKRAGVPGGAEDERGGQVGMAATGILLLQFPIAVRPRDREQGAHIYLPGRGVEVKLHVVLRDTSTTRATAVAGIALDADGAAHLLAGRGVRELHD